MFRSKLHFHTWFVLLVCFQSLLSHGQSEFVFPSSVRKTVIPFTMVNNLIIVKVKVNGVPLNFLLDTGVDETLLIGLESNQEVFLKEVESVKLIGLGSDEPINGLKSNGNTLEIGKLKSVEHIMYVVTDADLRFSATLGIAVNGILGYHFFKNHFIKVDYEKRKLVVYNRTYFNKSRLVRKYASIPVSIEKSKPYILLETQILKNYRRDSLKYLIDTGNSSAMWLFKNHPKVDTISNTKFNDYLGLGFSGPVSGYRTKIHQLSLGSYQVKTPIAAFPELESYAHLKMVDNRAGSIGGEILKRFTVFFDYTDKAIYLKQNTNFSSVFDYNKSGIHLQSEGFRLVKLPVRERKNGATLTLSFGDKDVTIQYEYQLKPSYQIAYLRCDSPAERAGLHIGDVISAVDNIPTALLSLEQVANLLKSDKEKTIDVEVDRDGVLMKFQFQLKNILD